MRSIRNVVSVLLALAALAVVSLPAKAQAWYGTGWGFRRPISLNNLSNPKTLTAFQVKLTLSSANFDFSKPLANGSDIRVTDADGVTLIPYYIQSYDKVGQTGTIWVKVPSIAGSASKNIFLYYGNGNPGTFTLPPTGNFTRPTAPQGNGLAENMVFDSATNKYYVVSCVTTNGPINLASSSSPAGPFTDSGTVLNKGAGGTWDDGTLYAPALVKSGSTWYLYYSGGHTVTADYDDAQIGVASATSVTGPYTRYSGNPVVSNSGVNGSWEQYRACEPYVYFSGVLNKWVMLYMGDAGQGGEQIETVGYASATSPLGPWTKFAGNPILPLSPAPAWDAGTIADPFAVEINGTVYIGYTGGPNSEQPWMTGYAITKDFQTFNKMGTFYGRGATGEWDEANAFRGAIQQFGNTWYFVYTSLYGWGVATMSSVSTPQGFDPMQVFDYYDNFPGTAIDPNKWAQPNQSNEGGSDSVSNGVLTLDSGFGTFHTLVGRREFGAGYLMELQMRSNNADGTGNHASEFGLSSCDRTESIRYYDYDSPYFKMNTTHFGNVLEENSQTPIDTNWHTHRMAWTDASQAQFQTDNNAWTYMTQNFATDSLKPFLFAYAAGSNTTMNVKSLSIRRYASPEPNVAAGGEQSQGTPGVPSAPQNLDATPGNAQIGLTWTASTGATSYKVKRSTTTGGPYTVITTVTTTAYTNTGLTNGTVYYYVVTALNANGESGNSNEVNGKPLAAPAAPTNLAGVAGDSLVALTWTASTNAQSYSVKRSTTNGSGYVAVAAGITSTNYTDTTAVNNTTYYYIVTASNVGGESAKSNQVTATPTLSVAPPSGLSTTVSGSKITLNWTQSSTAGITQNKVYRSTTNGGPYVLKATIGAGTTYDDTTAVKGTVYYYVVTAVHSSGKESAYSNQASGVR